MRGKLRDKRPIAKRDPLKRDEIERKRPIKRDNKNLIWLHQQLEEENYDLNGDDKETLVEVPKQ